MPPWQFWFNQVGWKRRVAQRRQTQACRGTGRIVARLSDPEMRGLRAEPGVESARSTSEHYAVEFSDIAPAVEPGLQVSKAQARILLRNNERAMSPALQNLMMVAILVVIAAIIYTLFGR